MANNYDSKLTKSYKLNRTFILRNVEKTRKIAKSVTSTASENIKISSNSVALLSSLDYVI